MTRFVKVGLIGCLIVMLVTAYSFAAIDPAGYGVMLMALRRWWWRWRRRRRRWPRW